MGGIAFWRQERDGKRLMGMVAIRDIIGVYCCRLMKSIVRNSRLVVEFLNLGGDLCGAGYLSLFEYGAVLSFELECSGVYVVSGGLSMEWE